MKTYFEKLYKGSFADFAAQLEEKVTRNEKSFIITANPETLMIGTERPEFDAILRSADTTITPDGIGVVKAAGMLGYQMQGRVTGVETVQALLGILNRQGKSLYLLGAKAEVLEALVQKLRVDYPGVRLAGWENGYVADKDAVFDKVAACQPDAVLVALGIPAQELLIARHYHRFQKGIFIGVGGSFDVLSGMKKRAPKLFIKLNLEWLYRIACEPKRFGRFYRSNVKFIGKIRQLAKEK